MTSKFYVILYSMTSIHVYSTKIEKSLPQPQRDEYQIAVCFMLSVFESQLPLLVIIWFMLHPIADGYSQHKNNSGAASSSSSSTSTALRMVASTVTEPTLNMPTTPVQLEEKIASAVATALTNQQPVNRDLFNSANSG